jgi:predicted permease
VPSSTFWRRVLARLRRNRLDDELREEIQQHLALRRQSLIDSGMDPEAADREARRGFGNQTVIRERAREFWTIPTLSSLAQDLRYAIRVARRSPGYAAAVIGTIALGTALNGAAFILINAFMLRPPQVADIDRVVRLDDGRPGLGPTYPDYVDYRDRVADAVDLAAFAGMGLTARIDAATDSVERVRAVLASGNYFDVLKGRAVAGRTFDGRADLPPHGAAEAVIGELYWTRRFHRDPAVIGRTIELNDQTFTIVGVVPASFRGVDIPGSKPPTVYDLYVPLWSLPSLQPGDDRLRQRTMWWGMQSVGRLRPGVEVSRIRAQVAAVGAALDREYPGLRHERAPYVAPLAQIDVRLVTAEAGIVAAAASGVTLLILLIASSNVANLGLARAVSRSREVAVRLSLGAGRGRIVRQFLTESVAFAACGTALGFALATLGIQVVVREEPTAFSLAPDFAVLAYGSLLALLVAAATGIVPALQASRPALLPGLKDVAAHPRRSRLQAVFVGGEIASCVLLVVMTAVLMRSAQKAAAIDPVLPVAHLLTVDSGEELQQRPEGPARADVLTGIARRLEALPGVTATAIANPLPFSGDRFGTVVRRIEAPDGPGTDVFLSHVTASFFTLTNLDIVRGSGFAGAPNEVIINQALAARLWGTGNPVGQPLIDGEFRRSTLVVVGVVRDAPFVSLQRRNEPFLFLPIDLSRGGSVLARTSGPAAALVRAADAEVGGSVPGKRIEVGTAAGGVAEEINAVQAGARMIGGLGALALALALFGVAAVTAHAVAQRTREIGVRMALGATTTGTTSLIVRQSMRPVVVGLLLGGAGAALVSRAVAAFLYGLSALDPIAFGTAGVFLCAAAIVASWIPARRAARVDPLIALRTE